MFRLVNLKLTGLLLGVIFISACSANKLPSTISSTFTPKPTLTTTSTPTLVPTSTATPIPLPTATLSPTSTDTPSPTAAPTHQLPILLGTPIPGSIVPITLENASRVRQLAVLGDGMIISLNVAPNGSLIAVKTILGIHLHESSTLEEVNFIPWIGYSGNLTFSSDDATIGFAKADGTLQLWSALSGEMIQEEVGNYDDSGRVAFSSDNTLLAVSTSNQAVQIWKFQDWSLLKTIELDGDISTLAFSPDNSFLAIGDQVKVILWDVSNGILGPKLDTAGQAATSFALLFSEDKTKLYTISGLPGRLSRDLKVWNITDGRLISIWAIPGNVQNGKLFDHANSLAVKYLNDGTLRVIDAKNKKLTGTIFVDSLGFRAWDLAGNGSIAALEDSRHDVQIWDSIHHKLIGKLSYSMGGDWAAGFDVTQKSQMVSAWGPNLVFWDNITHPVPEIIATNDSGWIPAIRFSPDGSIAALIRQEPFTIKRSIELWDVATHTRLRELSDDSGRGLAFSPNGSLLAATTRTGAIRIYQMPEGQLVRNLEGHSGVGISLKFSPDGTILASSAEDDTVRIWDIISGKLITKLDIPDAQTNSIDFSPDGKLLAIGTSNWNDNLYIIRIIQVGTWEQIRAIDVGQCEGIWGIDFSPDGKILATGTYRFPAIGPQLWDVATGTLLNMLNGYGVSEVLFSQDGRLLIAPNYSGIIQIWGVMP